MRRAVRRASCSHFARFHDGQTGVRFVLEVEDLGNTDSFRLATATGYGAFGVVDKGNITVTGGGLLTVP